MELIFNHEKRLCYEAIGMTREEFGEVIDKIGRLKNICNFPAKEQAIALAWYMSESTDAILSTILDKLYGTSFMNGHFSKDVETLYTRNDIREFIVDALKLLPEEIA